MPIETSIPVEEPGSELFALTPRGTYADMLRATAAEALHEGPGSLAQLLGVGELSRAQEGGESFESQIGRAMAGESPADILDRPRPSTPIPIAEARERVKREGLDQHLRLPEEGDIQPAALDIMLRRAQERADRKATIARGPQGVLPTILSAGTSFLVGALDPLNLAAAFIPVVGEARYAQMLAATGSGVAARLGVRAGVGAVEGAVGMATLQPLDWWAKTQEGQDWQLADALRNTLFGAGLGAGLRGTGGAIADLLRARKRVPLYPMAPARFDAAGRPIGADPFGAETQGGAAGFLHQGPQPRVETPSPDFRATIFADMAEKLRTVGVGEKEAYANAAIVAARYATRAERLDLSAEAALDLYAAEAVNVRAGEGAPIEGLTLEQRRRHGRNLIEEREAQGQLGLPGTERIGQGELAQRRADQPLRPGVEQKPMDVGLFSDEAKQKSFFQSSTAPPFYSAVGRAIETQKQAKASAGQWLGMLKNAAGVKPEEMEWLGLADWLKEQKGPVTKGAALDYVRANEIKVKEVPKGATEEALRAEQDALANRIPHLEGKELDVAMRRFDEIEQELARAGAGEATSMTKYGQYTLPGGENYRELLLTLPSRDEPGLVSFEQWAAETRAAHPEMQLSDADLAESYQVHMSMREETVGTQENYRSTHFDEPNIVAHVRFNDRVIDGKKTLFIEELQSDWHQGGRKKGYKGRLPKGWRILSVGEAADAFPDTWGRKISGYDRRVGGYIVLDSEGASALSVWGRNLPTKQAAEEKALGSGVPDAPFKTTWPELALKRMIRYAAENGYDKIAWTVGDVQAERYDLSRQISSITFKRAAADDDSGQIIARGLQRNEPVINKHVSVEDLPDIIGKEAADKLLAAKPSKASGFVEQRLAGLDLKVGGEGMKAFYDRELPARVNNLVKKFGAKVRVEQLETAEREGVSGIAAQFDDLIEGAGGQPVVPRTQKTIAVHSLAITPELRKAAVEQGFPLFQAGESGPRGRITLAEGRAVVELFKNADRSTFMHEMGHLWLDELARDASRANVPQALKDDLGTALRWLGAERYEDVTTAQHEQWARGFEQYLLEGRAPSNALARAFETFRRWLTEIYQALVATDLPITDEIRGVMDRLLASDREIAERLLDLPAPAKRDAMQVATAALMRGEPVRAGEMLEAAAARDPAIAEALGIDPPPMSEAETFRNLAAERPDLEALARADAARALPEPGSIAGPETVSPARAGAAAVRQNEMSGSSGTEGGQAAPEPPGGRVEAVRAPAARVTDPIEAIEREALEWVQNAADQGKAERIPEHIPGWDVDDAGPAPQSGAAAPHERGSGSAPAGEAARGPGADDRAKAGGGALAPVRSKTAQAAIAEEALARQQYDQMVAEGRLDEDLQRAVAERLRKIDENEADWRTLMRDGAACLAAGYGFGP